MKFLYGRRYGTSQWHLVSELDRCSGARGEVQTVYAAYPPLEDGAVLCDVCAFVAGVYRPTRRVALPEATIQQFDRVTPDKVDLHGTPSPAAARAEEVFAAALREEVVSAQPVPTHSTWSPALAAVPAPPVLALAGTRRSRSVEADLTMTLPSIPPVASDLPGSKVVWPRVLPEEQVFVAAGKRGPGSSHLPGPRHARPELDRANVYQVAA